MTKILREHDRLLEASTTTSTIIGTTNNNMPTKQSIGRRNVTLRVGVTLFLITVIVALLSSLSSFQISMNNNNNSDTPIMNDAMPISSVTKSSSSLASSLSAPSNGLRGKTATALPNDNNATKKEETIKLSLWLIPPGGTEEEKKQDAASNANTNTSDANSVYETTKTIIDTLAQKYHGPTFIPHVTILGGIEVANDRDAIRLGESLRDGLLSSSVGSDGIECNFQYKNFIKEPESWNQAMIFEMDRTESFSKLCKLSRKIINMEQNNNQNDNDKDECIAFPPPAREPHMTLYYGLPPNAPSSVSDVDVSKLFVSGSGSATLSCTSHRVMLWKTNPSTVEGVPDWTPIIDIQL